MINTKKQPNILLICSDQHSPRVLGCYGNSIIETPNLDRLAKEGSRFSSAYCNEPICVPSRMSFMTGRYPFHCGVLGNGSMLDSRIPSYATMLAASGYHTVLSGRMHFIGTDQRHGFLERLVGDCNDYAHGLLENRFAPLPDHLGNMYSPNPLKTVGAGHTAFLDYDADVAKETCKWLWSYNELDEQIPFMMTVGFISPHCPYIAPPELFDKYERLLAGCSTYDIAEGAHPFHREYQELIQLKDIPAENLHKAVAAYYALVENMDNKIGSIMATLEKTGLIENTIVVYFSDHGEMLGEHGRWHKGCFYEASAKVPLIVRLLGGEQGNRVQEDVVSLVDLFPTLCDWGKVSISYSVDGNSLASRLAGATAIGEGIAKSEYYDPSGSSRMVRHGEWKLCYYSGYDAMELYNLCQDPNEQCNRADDPACKEIVAALKALIFADGWSDDILKHDDEFLAGIGYYETFGAFSKKVSQNPLLPDNADCWYGFSPDRNYLQ